MNDQLLDDSIDRSPYRGLVHGALAVVATLFGLMTMVAGIRVMLGSDPGYAVFWPLLLYNTAMGLAYVAAGIIAWRNVERGTHAALAIFTLNLAVLGAIAYLHATGNSVAVESVRAMVVRTVAWLVLFLGLSWVSHGGRRSR